MNFDPLCHTLPNHNFGDAPTSLLLSACLLLQASSSWVGEVIILGIRRFWVSTYVDWAIHSSQPARSAYSLSILRSHCMTCMRSWGRRWSMNSGRGWHWCELCQTGDGERKQTGLQKASHCFWTAWDTRLCTLTLLINFYSTVIVGITLLVGHCKLASQHPEKA